MALFRNERVCITNADAAPSHLRWHWIGRVTWTGGVQFHTRCGSKVDAVFGIPSIRRERAEAIGARPCRHCVKDGE